MRCTGVILAGGGATRFDGAPKGLELVGGRRIIDRVADALREAADELLLGANAPEAVGWLPGVRTAGDVRTGEGAIGGLHAALHHAGGAVLVVAWDMPFVPGALLRALRARGEAGADVAAPASDLSGRGIEPLCAWYGPACLPALEARLATGDRRVVGFHADVRVATLPATEVSRLGDPGTIFANVNTRDDLRRLESR